MSCVTKSGVDFDGSIVFVVCCVVALDYICVTLRTKHHNPPWPRLLFQATRATPLHQPPHHIPTHPQLAKTSTSPLVSMLINCCLPLSRKVMCPSRAPLARTLAHSFAFLSEDPSGLEDNTPGPCSEPAPAAGEDTQGADHRLWLCSSTAEPLTLHTLPRLLPRPTCFCSTSCPSATSACPGRGHRRGEGWCQ